MAQEFSKAFQEALGIFELPKDQQPKTRDEYVKLLDKLRENIKESEKEFFDDLYESF